MKNFERVLRSHLKLRHLQILVVLDELRHVGKAADYLGMTQPAVSKTLKELEDAFGTRLFTRSSKGTSPTPIGVAVLRFARRVMHEFETARSELAACEGAAPPIRVGAIGTAIPLLLSRSIRDFKRFDPAITVSIEEGFLDVLLSRLRIGQFDFVLGRLEPRWLTPDIVAEPLYEDPISVVSHAAHPLAGRAEVHWEELARASWVLPLPGSPMRLRLDEMFFSRGLSLPADVIETTSILAVQSLLQERQVVGVLPQSLALALQERGRVRILPTTLQSVLAPIGVLQVRGRPSLPATGRFLDCLRRTSILLEATPPPLP